MENPGIRNSRKVKKSNSKIRKSQIRKTWKSGKRGNKNSEHSRFLQNVKSRNPAETNLRNHPHSKIPKHRVRRFGEISMIGNFATAKHSRGTKTKHPPCNGPAARPPWHTIWTLPFAALRYPGRGPHAKFPPAAPIEYRYDCYIRLSNLT